MKALFKVIFVIFGKKKISYENWTAAYLKWKGVVEMTRGGHMFTDSEGFENLPVWQSCGYCAESGKYIKKCFRCYLGNQFSKDGKVICYRHFYEDSVVAEYVGLMRGVSFKGHNVKARKDALSYAKTILKVIEEHGKSMGYEIPEEK
ncbi:hypothetical protein ACFL3M_02930 [Patescibacteria group bacterium]